jgi:hypothetical protein
VDLPCGSAADVAAAMHETLEQANEAALVDLDAGVTNHTNSDRQGEALEQREVDMHIEPLCLEASTGRTIPEPMRGEACRAAASKTDQPTGLRRLKS